MPQEDPPIQDTSPQNPVQAPDGAIHEREEEHEEWFDAPTEPELPRRPRRRLLGVGANPLPLALICVLLTACGFIGGVLVEKGQNSSSSGSTPATGLASRFAALRSGGGGGAGGPRSASGDSGAAAFFGGGAAGGGGGDRAGSTFGEVAYVSGHTLYVTNAEGATVKVTTSDASTVTKTVKANVKGIHPGETVVVSGSPGANGSVKAETIRVSEAGAPGGGLGVALFSGGGSGRGSSPTRGGPSGTGGNGAGGSGGEQALFGK